jgi:hypothetical protein
MDPARINTMDSARPPDVGRLRPTDQDHRIRIPAEIKVCRVNIAFRARPDHGPMAGAQKRVPAGVPA